MPKTVTPNDYLDHEIWVTDFTSETAIDFTNRLVEFSTINPDRPILVNINSYGGAVDALSSMISAIDRIPNPIITYANGCAMSCGAILLSHGDIRFCDPHARIMVHRVSAGTSGDTDDLKNDVTEIERVNRYWLGFLADNCNMGGYDELDSVMKSKDGRDRYLTAEEASEFGLIDIVGRPKIIQATMYEVIAGPDKIPIKKRAKIRAQLKEKKNKKTVKQKKKPKQAKVKRK